MATSFKVTPLCGVHNDNPPSYLVSIDGFNFLIDCGWNELFETSILQPLSRVATKIDAVLLSHYDTLHLGALPYAIKQFGLSAPVYSTKPIYMLGLMSLYDQYFSRKRVADVDLFTLDDVDSAFQSFTTLSYSQNFHLSGKGKGIVITPHVAGHLLGGTVWKITKDGNDVIYAVDINHRKEKHLKGTSLESFVRPAVLITDAFNALKSEIPKREVLTKDFVDNIRNTLEAGGNVLLPVDTAGRVLELLLILEEHWALESLNYPIIFLTNVALSTIDFVTNFLEWMSDAIIESFATSGRNPFNLEHVTLLSSKNGLDQVPDGPKVVLASMASLEAGFSHDIFAEWAADVKNLVLFTERGQFGTLARKLQADPPPKAVKVTKSSRVPLVGNELIAYEEKQRLKKVEEVYKAARIREEESKASHAPDINLSDPKHPLLDGLGPHGRGYRDIFTDGFVPSTTSVAPMFPFYDTSKWDAFGEAINPDHYVIKDEGKDQAARRVVGEMDIKLDEDCASLIHGTLPSKVISDEANVLVNSSLIYMDYEGRSDGRSVRTIIRHVSPLKLVLVHGSAEATEYLKQYCLDNICSHVYAPQIDETIDVTSDLSAYKVQLSGELMSNMCFKKQGDHEIAWVDAKVGETTNDIHSLQPISTAPSPHTSVVVGELTLANFKQFLVSKGVKAEFGDGGVLRCGEYVTVRKVRSTAKGAVSSHQQFIIEGPLSEEYHKIRDYLHSQFYFL